jgi:hypothetical protein
MVRPWRGNLLTETPCSTYQWLLVMEFGGEVVLVAVLLAVWPFDVSWRSMLEPTPVQEIDQRGKKARAKEKRKGLASLASLAFGHGKCPTNLGISRRVHGPNDYITNLQL